MMHVEISLEGNLQNHAYRLNEGNKDCKCESYGKSLTSFKKHINAVNEGHKDHKCGSCDKSLHIKR